MMQTLIAAGLRLAEALRAENEALAALDLPRAAELAATKIRASDAFATAHAACMRLDIRTEGREREAAEHLAQRLGELGAENRRLLERAVTLQSRVIETIARAALPRPAASGYGGGGGCSSFRQTPALALTARA